MKLNFNLLDKPIDIKDLTVLTIEDVDVFSSVVEMIYRYDEDSKLKLIDDKLVSLSKTKILTITDILGYNINSTPVLKLIYADLEEQLNQKPEVKTMIDKMLSTIQDLIDYELIDNELDLESDEITIQELFKVLGIQIEVLSDTIIEKIFEIIQVFKYLSSKKLLIFINIGAYLNKENLSEFSDFVSLNQLKVLMIEPRKVAGIKQYILDQDYFLTHEMV
ncbi:type II-A CRISPR-associated protein Csn2 [Carnobacterium sp. PL24RED07]|uniref:type II-A CRISPR-associated protein Csn2 n=1 Tax=unclassified Carnobacterium TaxID=257487 RepID=UPI0011EDF22D|nr:MULTISPECIES: type II-A CRISPR-associated protein Csn2 [unclassified Carnobacterium]KAF3301022.1 type II-A CRISPR-associated protein Csn2 [Carnobacterium sp. PL26RED25]KAF3305414.1 type II-A CRISPR-associated protein Csn2 [Carnobacterium sp. PL24RED07]